MARILIIDDDEALRTAFEQFLRRFGHIVTLAANGREGLHRLRQNKPDLVITDIFMPESDGLEVILEIKKKIRELSGGIPVIAVSGGMTMRGLQPISFLHQAKTLGADRVFSKPLDFLGICRAIEELLSNKVRP